MRRACLLLCLLFVLPSCKRRGHDGDSCQRTDDCVAPLRCVAQRCLVRSQDAAPKRHGPLIDDPNTSLRDVELNRTQVEPTPINLSQNTVLHARHDGRPFKDSCHRGNAVAGGVFRLEGKSKLRVHASSRNQITLSLHDGLTPKAKTLACDVGMNPKLETNTLEAGTYFVLVSGAAPANITVRALSTEEELVMTPRCPDMPRDIEGTTEFKLSGQLKSDAKVLADTKSYCAPAHKNRLVGCINIKEAGILKAHLNDRPPGIHIGLKAKSGTGEHVCAPVLNPKFESEVSVGTYMVFVESEDPNDLTISAHLSFEALGTQTK